MTLSGFGGLPTGSHGETVATRRQEQRMDRALRMLSRAPLTHDQRRAVINWLIDQPGARVTLRASDRWGRRGTAITFSAKFDAQVAERTVTAQQLVQEARDAGVEGLPDTTSTEQWQVPAHRAYRVRLVGLIYQPSTMTLRQSYSVQQTQYAVSEPQVQFYRGAYHFSLTGESTTSSGSATIWRAPERVRAITTVTPVCGRVALVCR